MKILSESELEYLVFNYCTRCGFCNTACPIYEVFSRLETKGPRGRILLARGVAENLFDINSVVEEFYSCALCGGCYVKCPAGLDTMSIVLTLRKNLAQKSLVPRSLRKLIANVLDKGNIFGKTPVKETPRKGTILYWRGCMNIFRVPELSKAQYTLLKKLGVNVYTVSEVCCGSPLILAGFIDEAKKIAELVANILESANPQFIVTGCPSCLHCFTKLYPEVLGIELPFEIKHISQLLNELLSFRNNPEPVEEIVYHDPCELARHCGIINEPREVLRKVGYKVIELKKRGLEATCCGGGGLLWGLYTEYALKAALIKLRNEILPLGLRKVITVCPTCLLNFRYSAILH
ncbi:MAG TPA: (Fe-S)-binding protein, partial [Thermoprotei archaeon]|nr:(Fe-S)-binding protein [Thermoprotei archaeon]